MIVLAEDSDSPNERSPLKGTSSIPNSPVSSPPIPPPTYAAAVAGPPHVQSYNSTSNPQTETHESDGRHSHPRGSPRRGRWHGGRHGSPNGRRGSRSSSPHRRPSTIRRFIRAFALAVLVIILWGMFLDSLDKLAGTYGTKRGSSILLNGSQWLNSLYRDVDPTTVPCPCRGNPVNHVAEVPGRALPIQYPPVLSPIPQVSVSPVLSANPSCQNTAGSSQVPSATPITPDIYTRLPAASQVVSSSSSSMPQSRNPHIAGFLVR